MALGARWIASAILLVACVGFGVGDRALANEAAAKVNVIAFGFYGDQNVFQSEAQRAAAIVAAKYGRGGMVIVRANIGARRAAMIADLRSAVAEVAARAQGGDDVLFLILTSHGSRAGIAVKSGAATETLSPEEVGAMLDGAGIGRRVIIVSACYSGVFARALANSRTVVITASDSDHASFGCRGGNAWTDFGRAFFAHALPSASGLSEAFATARSLIERQEAASNEKHSNPQMAGGEAVLARLDRAAPSNPSQDVASDASSRRNRPRPPRPARCSTVTAAGDWSARSTSPAPAPWRPAPDARTTIRPAANWRRTRSRSSGRCTR
jgi:hypothetical protein